MMRSFAPALPGYLGIPRMSADVSLLPRVRGCSNVICPGDLDFRTATMNLSAQNSSLQEADRCFRRRRHSVEAA